MCCGQVFTEKEYTRLEMAATPEWGGGHSDFSAKNEAMEGLL